MFIHWQVLWWYWNKSFLLLHLTFPCTVKKKKKSTTFWAEQLKLVEMSKHVFIMFQFYFSFKWFIWCKNLHVLSLKSRGFVPLNPAFIVGYGAKVFLIAVTHAIVTLPFIISKRKNMNMGNNTFIEIGWYCS